MVWAARPDISGNTAEVIMITTYGHFGRWSYNGLVKTTMSDRPELDLI